jgi:hypothetical protein
VKKGRHRRYEEARKFQRDLAGSFDVESFDLDEPDPFALPDTNPRPPDEDDQYAELAAKYADVDDEWDDD